MIVCICIHTELGYSLGTRIIFDRTSTTGVKLAVDNLLELFRKYDAKGCFALTADVLAKCEKETVLQIASEGHEVGLHVHPDDSYLVNLGLSSRGIIGLSQYSLKEQSQIIECSSTLFEEKFHSLPLLFVSGNWSENNATIRILEKNHFLYDLTPLPGAKGHVCDWTRLKRISLPYHPSPDDYQSRGSLKLLMIPVSLTILKEVLGPESEPSQGMGFLKAGFEEYYSQNIPVLHVSLHSPAMTSRYYLAVLEELFAFISRHKNVEYGLPTGESCSQPKTNYLPYLRRMNRSTTRTTVHAIWRRIYSQSIRSLKIQR